MFDLAALRSEIHRLSGARVSSTRWGHPQHKIDGITDDIRVAQARYAVAQAIGDKPLTRAQARRITDLVNSAVSK